MVDAVQDTPSVPVTTSAPAPTAGVDDKELVDAFRSHIALAKTARRKFHAEWKRNVELRLGRIAGIYTGGVSTGDDIKTELNPDWSLTKTKTANLYSQVPAVQVTHQNKQYAPAIAPFAKSLNYELGEKRANIGVAMEEVLNDVVNAAGIGAIIVGYTARFETVQVPAMDPSQLLPQVAMHLMQSGQMPMTDAQRVASDKFYGTRISPSDLLTPAEFTGSYFDDGDWVGRTGRLPWGVAKGEFKLTDEQKDKVLTGATIQTEDDLRSQPAQGKAGDLKVVTFDELYYWRYRVDPDEPSFKAIWRIVFVHGLEEENEGKPQVHEPWKGQERDEQSGKYVGACKFPIRVLTLTYITDNPIPPSDSSAGRPQVNDLRRSRSQMFQNRERSVPIRWFDVNRVDPLIQEQLMRGTFQGFIPSNGDGNRSIGEIARASYPSEDFAFDQAAKADLAETWQIGPNQSGTTSSGDHTKAEITTVQANFATRIGQERARVGSFFLSVAEVMAGLMCLYSDFPVLSDQERQVMQQAWDMKHILHDLVLDIRPDATIMLDSQTRIQRLAQFINLTAKSGFVNVMPIIAEMAALSGLDPAEVVVPPKPKEPDQPTILYRFSGKDDLVNPMVLGVMVKNKQAPSEQDIAAAVQLLVSAQQKAQQAALAPPPPPPGQPGLQPPADQQQPPPEAPTGLPGADAHPQWQLSNKIAARSRDIGGA